MTGDMYGDYSRLTFAPEKHFSAVLVQQGRVSLDADANELTAIVQHLMRRLTIDVVGRFGCPEGADVNFAITLVDTEGKQKVPSIAAGHCYVEGLLCEADAATGYYDQPDAFLDPELSSDRLPSDPPYLVYLAAWERHVSAVEDPSIRERALGDNGPDTAARSKVVWQVRATADFPPGSENGIAEWKKLDQATAAKAWSDWQAESDAAPPPQLRARTRPPSEDDLQPCIAPPDARYRGLENQLYRVEIHSGGKLGDNPTFKWSRDNGAAVFAIEELNGAEVTVSSVGRDLALGLDVGAWVELVDDRSVLRGERHALFQVLDVDPLDRLVTLDRAPDSGIGAIPARHPLLRRWDHTKIDDPGPADPHFDVNQGALLVAEGSGDEDGWLELENGVQIQFEPDGDYTPGDYWLIPARTATADVEWPRDDGDSPLERPPVGIAYAYAPLALVTDFTKDPVDLRATFKSLTAGP